MRLENRTAVITGSDSGMGQAMAVEFARAGADVAINYLEDEAGAQATLRQVTEAGRRGIVVQADVRDYVTGQTFTIDGGLEMNWGQGA